MMTVCNFTVVSKITSIFFVVPSSIAIPQLLELPDLEGEAPKVHPENTPENLPEKDIPLDRLLESLDEAAAKLGIVDDDRATIAQFVKRSRLSLQVSGDPLQVNIYSFISWCVQNVAYRFAVPQQSGAGTTVS